MAITDANGDTINPNGGWRILANSTARKTINLGAAPAAGRKIVIVDAVGDAASNNITINAGSGQQIDGANSLTISVNNQRKVLKSTGTGWNVITTTSDSNLGSTSSSSGDYDTSFSDLAGLSNDAGSGEVLKFGTGTLSAGKLYFLDTDGGWKETDSNFSVSGSNQLLGLAIGSSPTSNGLLVNGFFDAHSHLDNFSSGKPVYVSETSGKMTALEPSGSTMYKRVVGHCTNVSKVMYFNPNIPNQRITTVPNPSLYFDGSSTSAQIGSNSFANVSVSTDNGKYENGFLDFGTSGGNSAALSTTIGLSGGIYTFSMWFYSKRTGSDWGSLLRRTSAGVSSADYAIMTEDSTDELGVYTVAGGFASSGYDMTALEGSTTWTHIAVVANGSNSKFFINGALVGTANAVVTSHVKQIGGYDGTNPDTQIFAEGIDDFAYWGKALTDGQIKEIYDSVVKLGDLVN